tara:strand:+ start:323 stop:511 length:189 start_codon:yes stop_codon:yes gene_type:complete
LVIKNTSPALRIKLENIYRWISILKVRLGDDVLHEKAQIGKFLLLLVAQEIKKHRLSSKSEM